MFLFLTTFVTLSTSKSNIFFIKLILNDEFLILNLSEANFRSPCLIYTSIFFHIFALMLTFLISVVPSSITIAQNDCWTFDKEKCKSLFVFKLNLVMLASSLLSMFMCAFFSILIYLRLLSRPQVKLEHINQQKNRRAPNEYPEHQNPFTNGNTPRVVNSSYRTF